jgi:hypothetical protein
VEIKVYLEFHGLPPLQMIFNQQMSDWIKNGVLKKTSYSQLTYINSAHLVVTANRKMSLVTDMLLVNSYMGEIHLKMKNIMTVESNTPCV